MRGLYIHKKSLLPSLNCRFRHNVQPARTNIRSKPQQDCQHAKCCARADPVWLHRLFQLTGLFQENFPTNTQVWNHLRHRNDCRQKGVIRATCRCYNRTHTRSGTSVIRRSRRSSVPPRARVRPTTN